MGTINTKLNIFLELDTFIFSNSLQEKHSFRIACLLKDQIFCTFQFKINLNTSHTFYKYTTNIYKILPMLQW